MNVKQSHGAGGAEGMQRPAVGPAPCEAPLNHLRFPRPQTEPSQFHFELGLSHAGQLNAGNHLRRKFPVAEAYQVAGPSVRTHATAAVLMEQHPSLIGRPRRRTARDFAQAGRFRRQRAGP